MAYLCPALDFLPHLGTLSAMASLSPTTLTADEQALTLRVTAANLRDHVIVSLALGTGLRLAEIVGLILEGFDQQRVPNQFRP